jgi:hypothetical protein
MPRPVVTADVERSLPEVTPESDLIRRRRERAAAARRVRQRGRTSRERAVGQDSTQELSRRGRAQTSAGRAGRSQRQGPATGATPRRRQPARRGGR